MRSKPAHPIPWVLLVLAVAVHLLPPILSLALRPLELGRETDFPTYYHALREALRGGDPYDLQRLQALTDWPLAPFLYPPPFLLTLVWSLPLSLEAGFIGMFVLNELLLGVALGLMRRYLGLGWKGVALLLATFFPLWENLVWGQVNLLVLVPVLGAMVLASRRPLVAGALVGTAAMLKVLPGVLLLYWGMRREWRPVAVAAASAVVLTVISLPLVGPGVQWAYYVNTLTGVAGGHLHEMGISVPITSEYSHSVLGVLSHVFPGPDRFQASSLARGAAAAVILGLLALWALRVRQGTTPEAALASLLGLVSVASTYSWEHYLVLLLPALVLAARGGAPRWPLGVLYVCAVLPLWLLPIAWSLSGGLFTPLAVTPWISAGKLVGTVGICALCLRAPAPEAREASAPAALQA
jgi:alpha-1,2-mannosyltransferase